MLRNYLFVALRNVKRHAAFSLLNIIGLSVSMAVGLVLILFVRQAAQQDEFHEHADRLVRVYSDFKSNFNRSNGLYGTSPARLGEIMMEEVPGVERAAKIRGRFRGTLIYEGTGLAINGIYADPEFFNLFSFELASGDSKTALLNPGSLVLSPSEAIKFFGGEDPIGKVMSVSDGTEYTVTGILKKDDYDTIFPLSAVASYATLEADSSSLANLDSWTRSIYQSYTFALLDEGADLKQVQERVSQLIPIHFAERDENVLVGLTVQPLSDISLGVQMGNEMGSMLPGALAWFLATLALLILLTASFNYVGLTVSRSLRRSKEVGVRKVFGAARSHITTQFIFETIVISLLSVLCALVLLQWLVPSFNKLSFVTQTGLFLEVDYGSGSLYLVVIVFTLGMALVAGLYPALFLSRFQPADAVKGASELSKSGGSRLRKTLVVVQFSMSLIFLIVTVTMIRQARFMQQADYGFEQENIVNVRLFDVPYERFRDRVRQSSLVINVSGISIIPATGSRSDVWVSTPGMTEEDMVKGYQFSIDENVIDNLGLTLLAGRNVGPESSFENTRNVLVNELLVNTLQLGPPSEAVGQTFIMGDTTQVQILGVLKNIHTDAFSEAISPNIFLYELPNISWANVRVLPGKPEEVLDELRDAWKDMGFARSADMDWFETQLQNNFSNLVLRDMYQMIGFIALLAIIIACLGLLGIASFNVERRTKEISIRKVLGADVGSILRLLSLEFLILIAIATIISLPTAYILSDLWLQTFAYRVPQGVGIMALSLGVIALIALMTIGTQSLKAALANPMENLRDD